MLVQLRGKSGKEAQVDLQDWELITQHKWYLSTGGYATTTHHKKGSGRKDKSRNVNMAMHHLILGEPSEVGLQRDHINGDRLDNRRKNLRWVTAEQNAQNAKATSSYGVKGITKDGGKWVARIRGLFLGSFTTPIEAGWAYDKAARHFFGEYARLNYPDVFYEGKVRYVDFVSDKKKLQSEYVGVTYFGHGGKRVKRWRAVHKKKTLGYFYTELEAAHAYQKVKNNENS